MKRGATKRVFFDSPCSVEHPITGVLIAPGWNEYPVHTADALLATKMVSHHAPAGHADVKTTAIPAATEPAAHSGRKEKD